MPGNLAYRAYQLIWTGLDWLYPPSCGGCGESGSRWCMDCQRNSKLLIERSCCEICGDISVSEGVCDRCKEEKPAYTQVRSWATFEGPVRNVIHRLKYKGDIGLGESLAKPLIPDLLRIGWPIDLVIPVPLSLARMKERGYNQAALIALPVAIGLQLSYRANGLRKVINTRTQVGLSFNDRRMNVIGAFEVEECKVTGKRVLLVDDVTTSGSTLSECARVLKAAGAIEVYGYTFARAIFSKANTGLAGQIDVF